MKNYKKLVLETKTNFTLFAEIKREQCQWSFHVFDIPLVRIYVTTGIALQSDMKSH